MTRTHIPILIALLLTPAPLAAVSAADDNGAAGTGHVCYVDATVINAYCADAALDATILACNVPYQGGYACRVEWSLAIKTTGVDVCGEASATSGNEIPVFCTYAGGRATDVRTVYYPQSVDASKEYSESGVVRVSPAGFSWRSAPISPATVIVPPAVPAQSMNAESPAPALAGLVAVVNQVLSAAGDASEDGLVAYDGLVTTFVDPAKPLLA